MNKLKPDKVTEIISRFEATRNPQLENLKADARVLAAQMYFYADAMGDLGKLHAGLYVDRKTEFSRLKDFYIESEDLSAAAAEVKAGKDKEYKELYRREKDINARYEKARHLFKAIEKNLDRMNQEIADLRKERDYQRHLERA